MVNYYKKFDSFKKERALNKKINYPLNEFEQHMMIYFGFGGRNNTVRRWLNNFNDAGLIKITKNKNKWTVNIV